MKAKFIIVFSFVLLFSCFNSIHRVSRMMLGTVIDLTVISNDEDAVKSMNAAFDEISRIEKLMSFYKPESEISKINQNAGVKPTAVSRELFNLIKKSIAISNETKGAFDITL